MNESLAVWFIAVRCNSGADVFTERLCAGLNRRGIRSEITWLPLRAEYTPWTVSVPRVPNWATVAHINSWLHPRFIPSGLPVVATVHLCVHDNQLNPFKSLLQRQYHRNWIRPIEAATLRLADMVVAVSDYTANQYKKIFGRRDIRVIHNGIDCNFFTPITNEKTPHHPFRFIYVGNWTARKGVGLLGQVLERLGDDFELVYTADRHDRHESYPLPSNTRCLGRLSLSELLRAYREADALLFPTRLEGFGLVAAEAMACGVPVIASKASSLPEIVEHGVTGWLCEQHTVSAFVDACRHIAGNEKIWRDMGQASRERVVHLFTEENMIEQYINTYRSLLGRKGCRASL